MRLGRVKTPKSNGNFVSTSINLKNKSAGDGCRDKTIEKTILRTFRACTFSRSQGHSLPKWGCPRDVRFTLGSDRTVDIAGGPFRAKLRHRAAIRPRSVRGIGTGGYLPRPEVGAGESKLPVCEILPETFAGRAA